MNKDSFYNAVGKAVKGAVAAVIATNVASKKKGSSSTSKYSRIGPRLKNGQFLSRSSTNTLTKRKRKMSGSVGAQGGTNVKHKKVFDNLKNKRTFKKKVPKKLRKQIESVLVDKKVRGYHRLYHVGGNHAMLNGTLYAYPSRTTNDQQWCFALPMGLTTTATVSMRNGQPISRLHVLHAASRCFNGKVPPGSTVVPGYSDNNNMSDPRDNNGTGNTSPSALKLEVIDIKSYINMKNNSQQTYNLEMYVCKPKYKRVCNFSFTNTNQCVALADWQDEITVQKNQRVETQGFTNQPATYGTLANAGNNINTLGMSPEGASVWKSLWKYEKYVIRLEPGQSHSHTITGDSTTIDFTKDYKDSQFCYITPFERDVFFVAKPDLTWGKSGVRYWAGRNAVTTPGSNDTLHPLCFEVQTAIKFTMPEPTGFRGAETAVNKTLNNRIYRYATDFVSSSADLGYGTEVWTQVDDNNPDVNATI